MSSSPLRIGLIGAGRIGRNHAELIAHHIPGVELAAIADPAQDSTAAFARQLDVSAVHTDPTRLIAAGLDAVVITSPTATHSELISQAADAGLAIFCEKPASVTVPDLERALAAVERAGVLFQIGFNRRYAPGFAAARSAIEAGELGSIQLLRSNSRDPHFADPTVVAEWAIFTQTLIHDFDTLNWLNPGAEPVRVYAQADALIRPDFRERGLLDTALVTVAYSNGALAMADASFQAVYGYDVRAEIFGSEGMATAGHLDSSDMHLASASGRHQSTVRSDTELMRSSYLGELAAFAEAVRTGVATGPGADDAFRALRVAHSAIESVRENRPINL